MFTSVETPPNAFTVSATQRSMSASTVTLQPMPRTGLPVSSAIFFAVAAAFSPLRSAIITLAPAPENVRAMPSPMFWAPPVTMATWSVMRNCSNASNLRHVPFSLQSSSWTPPPLTVSTWPLTQAAAGEQKKSAA